jgi:hypothetical protein
MENTLNIPITQGVPSPTTMQVETNYYYTQALAWINTYLTAAQQKEMFGKDPVCDYNKINNFWYLLMYMQMIADQQQIYINQYGTDQPCSYYQTQFTCMIAYFQCLNIDITPLLCIFGFYCNCGQTGVNGVGQDQIGTSLIVYP